MNRREALKLMASGVAATAVAELPANVSGVERVERWAPYEIRLTGPATGNPFADVVVSAEFTRGARTVKVDGFYDGGVHLHRPSATVFANRPNHIDAGGIKDDANLPIQQ